jgi:hypothetical protein
MLKVDNLPRIVCKTPADPRQIGFAYNDLARPGARDEVELKLLKFVQAKYPDERHHAPLGSDDLDRFLERNGQDELTRMNNLQPAAQVHFSGHGLMGK